jgi:hypothetical protein
VPCKKKSGRDVDVGMRCEMKEKIYNKTIPKKCIF